MHPLVITPTYNERENIAPFIAAVLAVDPAIHILVVDDGSPDGTGDLAEELAAATGRVHVLHRPGKQGLGTAYVVGFRYALAHDYDYIVQMDADLSHRPADLPRLLHAAAEADLVIGSRAIEGGRVENWSPLRHIISKGGSLYARTLLTMPVRDITGGFKCFSRRALRAVDLDAVMSNGFGFQVEMTYLCYRAGLCIVEVPIVFPDRTHGRSKMSYKIFGEAARLVWQLRRRTMDGSLTATWQPPLAESGPAVPGSTGTLLAPAAPRPKKIFAADGGGAQREVFAAIMETA